MPRLGPPVDRNGRGVVTRSLKGSNNVAMGNAHRRVRTGDHEPEGLEQLAGRAVAGSWPRGTEPNRNRLRRGCASPSGSWIGAGWKMGVAHRYAVRAHQARRSPQTQRTYPVTIREYARASGCRTSVESSAPKHCPRFPRPSPSAAEFGRCPPSSLRVPCPASMAGKLDTGASSPEQREIVFENRGVAGDEGQTFRDRLGDEHPVEGVTVVRRQ